ncbi:MAG: pseudouridine synthase [Thermotaleaceae bacterium]
MAKTIRLDKLLGNMGLGTRKEIKTWVKKGNVTVNDVVQKDSSQHIDPHKDIVKVNGEILEYREYIYILMNKPQGVLSASYDPGMKTVVDLLAEAYQIYEPFPIGRLDKDTEGLLLISNDGKLAHELLSPKKHIPKTYYAKIEGKVDSEDIKSFKEGVVLEDGYKTLPGELSILKSEDISEIELTIYEGKYHQVKRMFDAVGKKVTYLKRIAMGSLELDQGLALGDYRELTPEELEKFKRR